MLRRKHRFALEIAAIYSPLVWGVIVAFTGMALWVALVGGLVWGVFGFAVAIVALQRAGVVVKTDG